MIISQLAIPKRTGPAEELLDYSTVSEIIVYGDSYSNPGLSASPSSESWINQLATTMGKTLTNGAASGTGYLTMLYNSLRNTPQLNSDKGIVIMTGLNDCNFRGNDVENVNHGKVNLKYTLVNQYLGSLTVGGAVTVNGAVYWNRNLSVSYSKANYAGNPTYKVATTSQTYAALGAELVYNFTNDHVVIGTFFTCDTSPTYTHLGNFDILIDDVLVYTYVGLKTDRGGTTVGWESYGDSRPECLIFSGLTNAAHTVKIRPTYRVPSGGQICMIDYFGHFMDEADMKPTLVMEVIKNPDYAHADPFDNGSDAAIEAYNTMINETVAELKAIKNFPIVVAPTNSATPVEAAIIYNSTDFNADNIHCNNSGHDKLTAMALTKISSY